MARKKVKEVKEIKEVKEMKEVKGTEKVSYNICTKLQKLRKDFHLLALNKEKEVLEHSDFLVIMELLEKYNLTTIMNMTNNMASLVLIDCDNVKSNITFSIPNNTKCYQGIESFGGKLIYQKKLLYLQLIDAYTLN